MEYIYDYPGASAQEMMEYIRVDKATLTKNIKKLAEISYVKIVGDEKDKRVEHLYSTEKAVLAYGILCSGFTGQEIHQTDETLEQMMKNVNQKIRHRKEDII